MKFTRRLYRNEFGQTIALFALLIPLLFGFLGLALDMSWIAYNKSKIQDAADLAALAGAQFLPEDTSKADTTAQDIFIKNYGKSVENITFFNSGYGIKVHCEENIPLLFLSIFGFKNKTVTAKAEVIIEPLSKPLAIIPLGISNTTVLTYGQEITIYGDLNEPSRGNFGIIDPTADGSMQTKDLEQFIINDYKGEKGMPEVGALVNTKTGNMASTIANGFNGRLKNGKITFVCPVVNWSVAHGSDKVPVLGFASFDTLKVKSETSSQVSITGRFIELIDYKAITKNNINYYGIKAIRLVK